MEQGHADRTIHSLAAGSEVAIMPCGATSEVEVSEITTVSHVQAFTVQLANGKLYARTDGRGLVTNEYIQPAAESHKLAIQSRSEKR